MRSPEFIGAEPVERATWVCLLAYCAEQENGGRIENCAGWGDRRWMQTCGITLEEVQANSELWFWQNGDLLVAKYPIDDENKVKARKVAGRKGGAAKALKQTASKNEICQKQNDDFASTEQIRTDKNRGEESRGDNGDFMQDEDLPVARGTTNRPPPPAHTLADWKMECKHLYVGRDENDDFQALFDKAAREYDSIEKGFAFLIKAYHYCLDQKDGKGRVYLSDLKREIRWENEDG
jgi:hypothetical protein